MTTVILGEDKTIIITLKKSSGGPFSLVGLTAASFKMATTTGVLTKTLGAGISVFGAAANGQLQVILTQVESATLLEGDSVIELILDFGSIRKILNIRNACVVRPPRF